MTEPTRDALHAETLGWLCRIAEASNLEHPAYGDINAKAAHAAECVRVRAELEAEVERLLEAMYDATLSLSNHPCGEAGCVASLGAIHKALRHAAGLGWVVVDEAGNLRYSTRSRAAADLFARRFGWKVTYAAATREGADA